MCVYPYLYVYLWLYLYLHLRQHTLVSTIVQQYVYVTCNYLASSRVARATVIPQLCWHDSPLIAFFASAPLFTVDHWINYKTHGILLSWRRAEFRALTVQLMELMESHCRPFPTQHSGNQCWTERSGPLQGRLQPSFQLNLESGWLMIQTLLNQDSPLALASVM